MRYEVVERIQITQERVSWPAELLSATEHEIYCKELFGYSLSLSYKLWHDGWKPE
jgi:hypothetical protein